MMNSLSELQQIFIDGLLNKNNNLLNMIHSKDAMDAAERLAVYKDSILGSHQKILKNIYPVCEKLVGTEFFYTMANAYFNVSHSSIHHYGHDFAEFMQNFKPLQTLSYISDMARFEWFYHIVYVNKDIDDITMQISEKSVLSLPQSSHLLFSPYPIHQIWKMHQDKDGSADILEFQEDHFYYLIFRQQYARKFTLLTFEEWQILHWAKKKITFQNLCYQIIDDFPELNILEFFKRALKNKWLIPVNQGD